MKRMFSLIVGLCMVMCLLSVSTFAEETISGTTTDGFSWTLTPAGDLTVSGTGVLADGSDWSDYADSILTMTLESGIEGLDEAVFDALDELPALTTLNLSDTVTELEPAILNDYCPNLSSITVDTDNAVYSASNGILYNASQATLMLYPAGKTEALYVMPSTVTAIELDAFTGCDQITAMTLSSKLKSVDEGTFRDCSGLQNFFLDSSNTSFTCDNNVALIRNKDNGLIGYCVGNTQTAYTVPDGVEIICEHAFRNAASLTTVNLPLSLTEVEYAAFVGCNALSTAAYPGTEAYWNTVEIGNKNDLLLDALTFGTTDTMSGTCGADLDWVLELTSGKLTISGSGEMTSAPWNKALVQSVVFDGSITSICDNAFQDCRSLKTVAIPNTVTSIGQDAFFRAGLTSVVVPASVTFLGESAFDYCVSLTNAIIGSGVTTIIDNTFENCKSLTEVTISKSVTTIGDDAFYNCPLETVYYTGSEPQWGLISIANGNISLLTAEHIFASSLLVEWNSNHTVLSLSSMVDGSAYVTAAFYNADGQMLLAKHYTAAQVKSGVGISDSTVDLTQCTATVMILDEKFAPVGVPYTPDAPQHLYETLWLFATEHAYIDGDRLANKGTLLFSDGAVTREADATLSNLDTWDLGKRYVLTVDASTNSVIDIQPSADFTADSSRLMDIEAEIVYGTSSNQANNRYSFTVSKVEGIFTDDEIPLLFLDSTSGGLPATISAADFYNLAGTYSADEYQAIDRNNDGEIDYLLVRPYIYGLVTKAGTSAKYGAYIKLAAPDGTVMQFDGNSIWYLEDYFTDPDLEAEEDDILKMSWNPEEGLYEADILPAVSCAAFEAINAKKNQYTFAGADYYLAESCFAHTPELTSSLLDQDFDIVVDDDLLISALLHDYSYKTMDEINAQLVLVVDVDAAYSTGTLHEKQAIEYMTIDGETHIAVYQDMSTTVSEEDLTLKYVQFADLEGLAMNKTSYTKTDLEGRLFILYEGTKGRVYLEALSADTINTQLNASTDLLNLYEEKEAALDATGSSVTFDRNKMVADNVFFFATLDDGEPVFAVMTPGELSAGMDETAYGQVLGYENTTGTRTTILGGYVVYELVSDQADGYLYITEIGKETVDGLELTIQLLDGEEMVIYVDSGTYYTDLLYTYTYNIMDDLYTLSPVGKDTAADEDGNADAYNEGFWAGHTVSYYDEEYTEIALACTSHECPDILLDLSDNDVVSSIIVTTIEFARDENQSDMTDSDWLDEQGNLLSYDRVTELVPYEDLVAEEIENDAETDSYTQNSYWYYDSGAKLLYLVVTRDMAPAT